MKISALTFANLAVASMLLLTPFLAGLTSSEPYDPWADLDDSGTIDIFDLVKVAGTYGTTGDPTKNVNVMNWPVTNQQTVWYQQTWGGNSPEAYNASGFSQMHLSWHVTGLSGSESVTIVVNAVIFGEGDVVAFPVQMIVVTETQTPSGALTIPVPSEIFYFFLYFDSGTTASVTFAFYLTYA